MSVAIVIPARFASSRYPGKPLAPLTGADGRAKPLIQRSWEAACRVSGIDKVFVATDSTDIAEVARGFGAEILMTSANCRNGTERCAEAVAELAEPLEIVINLQGDAPLTPPHFLAALVERMRQPDSAPVATPSIRCSAEHYRQLAAEEKEGRVGGTTVVADSRGRALYFSKRIIPHVPPSALEGGLSPVRLHIGVYAYRPAALESYVRLDPSPLEELEGLEQLRFLEAGVPIDLVEMEAPDWEIWELNNPSDVPRIEQALQRIGLE